MPIVVRDRVKEVTTTTGTANFVLGGASTGFQSFSVIGANNYTYYCCVDSQTGDWEVGYGQYTTTAGGTLVRDTVLSNSASTTNKISFSAGSKELFITYPAEKAIYEEEAGNVLIDGGPITVIGSGVTGYTSLSAALGEMYANINAFVQFYAQNQSGGSDASTDFVVENDLGTDVVHYADFGINSSNYSSVSYPIYEPNSGYLYVVGDGGSNTAKLFVGSADSDVVIHAGGFDSADIVATFSASTKNVTFQADVNAGGDVNAAGGTFTAAVTTTSASVTSPASNEFVTKSYVDNATSAGLHIHVPVLVETTGNLTATYTQGGTTFDITDITGGNTVTTSVNHGLSVNDQIWLYNTAGNGLSINTAYFVYSTPALNTLTLSTSYGGLQLTGLTNASGLTYNTRANSGVGAKLTNSGTQVELAIDGITSATSPALAVGSRVMVRLQTNPEENGIYTVTNMGSGATNWELTRATDANRFSPQDTNGLAEGDYFYTQAGNTNAGDSHVLTTPGNIIIGYTGLTYTQFSGSVVYSGVAPINVTGQQISLTGTVAATNGGTGTNTVTTGDLLYGSATNTWSKLPIGSAYRSLVVNAGGTQVEWNAIALDQVGAVSGALPAIHGGTGATAYNVGEMLYANTTTQLDKVTANTTTTKKFLSQTGTGTTGQAPNWAQPAATDITGLAASATTDTTDAGNITSGTLNSARLSGSYTGITGVGTLTAGTWNGTAIGATYGGTGLTSYVQGDLLYATSSSTVGRLADVVAGNALLSGGVGSDPAWGKVGLQTHVDGTLQVTNGGTGATTLTGYVKGNGTSAFTASASIPNSDTTATSANTANAIVARDSSGDFSAGTITASLNGNASTATSATSATSATTATTATNQSGGTVSATSITTSGTTITCTGGSAATYGAVTIRGVDNGWSGIHFQDNLGVNCNTLMARSSDGYGGVYNKADNAWLVQWDGSGNFTATANVTAFSDERLKKDWASLSDDFLGRLAKVKHGIYTRIDSGQRQAGVSAQDMQKVLAEVVVADEAGTLSLAYGNAALVAVIALANKVLALETELNKLKG